MTTDPDPFDGTLFDPSEFIVSPSGGEAVSSELTPTQEQQAILDAVADGKTTAISAGAGTGKTSTLRMIAEVRPQARMLYLVYNTATALAAKKAFRHSPSDVTPKTGHSLAFEKFGKPILKRLHEDVVTAEETARILGISRDFAISEDSALSPTEQVRVITRVVKAFCRSADSAITGRHLRFMYGLSEDQTAALEHYFLPLAALMWADLTAGPNGRCKPDHDVYLKQWQLSKPELNGFDVILYDEAQDADPVIADVVERQDHLQIIAVGDENQAIYGWRGAGDFLQRVDAVHRLRLTQSWRFGEAIAREANTWLGVIGTDMRLIGNPERNSKLASLERPDAVLCRSNAGAIAEVLTAQGDGVKVHLEANTGKIKTIAEGAKRLIAGKKPGCLELAAFSSWGEVVDYAENDPGGSALATEVRLIQHYGADLVIKAMSRTYPENEAKLTVSTAHKGKGKEWGTVRIADDFPQPLTKDSHEPLPIETEAAMLAYVAVTRAKTTLDTGGLAWVHKHLAWLRTHSDEPVRRAHRLSRPDAVPAIEEAGELLVQLPQHKVTDPVLERLKALLAEHPGPTPVLLQGGDLTLRLPEQFNVARCPELTDSLRTLLSVTAVAD